MIAIPASDDDLQVLRDDLAYEQRRYEQASRAPHDGRLTDALALQAAQRRRLQRIADLQTQITAQEEA